MQDTSLESVNKLIAQIVWKVHRRAYSAGMAVEFDDLYQEGVLAWMRARKGFKPELGNQFSTYLVKALYSSLNQYLELESRQSVKLGVISLNASEDFNLETILESEEETPEMVTSRQQDINRVRKKLSPAGRFALDCLLNPPPSLLNEIDKIKAKRQMKSENGQPLGAFGGISIAVVVRFVSKLCGFNETESLGLRREISMIRSS